MAKKGKTGKRRKGKRRGSSGLVPVKGIRRKDDGVRFLGPEDPVTHECNLAGRCCFDAVIVLQPFDVWRMFTSPAQPLSKHGIHTTSDLFDRDNGLAQLGLGPQSKLPMAFFNPVRFEGEAEGAHHCPMLEWDDDALDSEGRDMLRRGEVPGPRFFQSKGTPTFRCGLGAARPMHCDLFPFGRLGDPGEEGKGHWRFFCDTKLCRRCMPDRVKSAGIGETVEQYIARPVVDAYLKRAAQFIQLMGMVAAKVDSLEGRVVLARTVWDFDGVLLNQGISREDLPKARPGNVDHLIMSGVFMVNTVLSGEPPQEDESPIITPEGAGKIIVPGTPKIIMP